MSTQTANELAVAFLRALPVTKKISRRKQDQISSRNVEDQAKRANFQEKAGLNELELRSLRFDGIERAEFRVPSSRY